MNKQKQVENIIITSLEQQVYKEGDKILSIRSMAKNLNVSTAPVLAAYQHLVDIGILEARSKSGYYIAKQDDSFKIENSIDSYQSYDFETDLPIPALLRLLRPRLWGRYPVQIFHPAAACEAA